MLQTNNTGMCSQCLSSNGPASAQGMCTLPAHTAQALGCSASNRPRSALGCMQLPGLSLSGSGAWVVLRGADSVGPAARVMRCLASEVSATYRLSRPLPLGFLGVQQAHLLRRMMTVQNPKKS